MALWLAFDAQGNNKVTDQNPIQTRHSSNGEEDIIPLYLYNDGFRTNASDTTVQALRYTNMKLKIEGVYYKLANTLAQSYSAYDISVEIPNGQTLLWNVGTILLVYTSRLDASGNRVPNTYAGERMYVQKVTGTTSVQVVREYKTGMPTGTTCTLSSFSVDNNYLLVPETASVSLRLPYARDYVTKPLGTEFLTGGSPIDMGLDPTELTANVPDLTTTTVYCSNGLMYKTGSLIKIDNEIMKVESSVADRIQVTRGYQSTAATHDAITGGKQNLIYLVGLVDVKSVDSTTHKFWLRNQPPAGLPTQKKQDIRIIIEADEEPL